MSRPSAGAYRAWMHRAFRNFRLSLAAACSNDSHHLHYLESPWTLTARCFPLVVSQKAQPLALIERRKVSAATIVFFVLLLRSVSISVCVIDSDTCMIPPVPGPSVHPFSSST